MCITNNMKRQSLTIISKDNCQAIIHSTSSACITGVTDLQALCQFNSSGKINLTVRFTDISLVTNTVYFLRNYCKIVFFNILFVRHYFCTCTRKLYIVKVVFGLVLISSPRNLLININNLCETCLETFYRLDLTCSTHN